VQLRQIMSDHDESFTDEIVDEMIKLADIDGDDHVSFEEFERLMEML
jgi:calmodulin